MFTLSDISLVQFRNYAQTTFQFSERVVGICGLNGSGKTNLLDAIYYLSFSRSYHSRSDAQNVAHGMEGFRIDGLYRLMNQEERVTCIVRENLKKERIVNGELSKKLSTQIGKLPVVMIAPDDISLITGGGEERRKWLDTLISQLDEHYLQSLIAYQRTLTQRNSLLKQQQETGISDSTLLQVLNEQLCTYGNPIFATRQAFLEDFLPRVTNIYLQIANKEDGLDIQYESSLLQQSFANLLLQTQSRDFLLARTTRGPHRDDLIIYMGKEPFKQEASQGQRKSLLFAMKLAEWEVLEENKGFPPILLLDDIFEKLDSERMNQLLHRVCVSGNAQVFITDTHAERLEAQLQQLGVRYQLLSI
jgi:DNA replication and repair protein RecF